MPAELERLRQAATEAQAQVAEAQAAADEARAQAQAAQLAAAQPTAAQLQVAPLPRPSARTFNVQSAMGLEDDDELYGSIQVSGDGGLGRDHNHVPSPCLVCLLLVSQADNLTLF